MPGSEEARLLVVSLASSTEVPPPLELSETGDTPEVEEAPAVVVPETEPSGTSDSAGVEEIRGEEGGLMEISVQV